VEDGKEGFIVPARSPDAVYEKMKMMAQQPELCEAMGKAAAAKMKGGGSWASYGEKLLDIYRSHHARLKGRNEF
jgi:glycosyltransferase involved in cell wall biosynthesis